jgi:hypothetical protein
MTTSGPDLLALALALDAEGTDEDETVAALVEVARCSGTTLMGACTYALSLARHLPYDLGAERPLRLLTRALQQAVQQSGELPSEDRTTLLRQIVEASGLAAVAPGAAARRAAEVDADLDKLWAADSEATPTS